MERYKVVIIAAAVIGVIVGGIVAASLMSRTSGPDFTEYEAGPERKQAFFDYFLPIVQQHNEKILKTREQLISLRESGSDLSTVESIAKEFGMDTFDGSDQDWATLMRRADVVPPSLALAQAANESAWGTSRFAVQGNNFFGQWCFEKGCGLVPKQRDDGKTHEVADFSSPSASVESYMENLNQHNAYRELRDLRAKLRRGDERISGIALAAGLEKYSERGDEYIKELRSMIRFNKLGQYDTTGMASAEATSGSGP